MRALGRRTSSSVSGAIAVLAEEFVSSFAGFATAWTYWFLWIVVAISELTAIGIYVHCWAQGVPQWLSVLCALLLLYGSNLLMVRAFGEMEFWFAVIKVTTIVVLIVAGVLTLVFGFGHLGRTASFANLWTHGGMFPAGILGVLLTLQIVTFAYSGVELIGMTAAEAESPHSAIPRATNSIIYRILAFYIGALIIIM